jgi:hypothetical protein
MADNWHRRQALMIAPQLPDNASDANAIIRELQNLVDTWLHPPVIAAPSRVLTVHRDKE